MANMLMGEMVGYLLLCGIIGAKFGVPPLCKGPTWHKFTYYLNA
jgi:hypothetical protein